MALIALGTVMIASDADLAGKAPGAIYGAGLGPLPGRDHRREEPRVRHHLRGHGLLDLHLRHPRRHDPPGPLHPAGALRPEGRAAAFLATLRHRGRAPRLPASGGGGGLPRRSGCCSAPRTSSSPPCPCSGISVWLRRARRKTAFTVVPMAFVMVVTLSSLVAPGPGRRPRGGEPGSSTSIPARLNGVVSVLLLALALVLDREAVKACASGEASMPADPVAPVRGGHNVYAGSDATTTTTTRVHNFSAGPAVLPLPVLEQVRAELLDYRGTGMSVMEMSHRSAAFEDIIGRAEADLRSLLGLSRRVRGALPPGRGTLQFAMVPTNLRPAGASADYVLTGHWSKAALKEAEKLGAVRVAGLDRGHEVRPHPRGRRGEADARAAYLHFTSNNTIYGTEWFAEPAAPAGVPLVCDASSDFLSRPLPVDEVRPPLRGRAEEPGAGRGHGRGRAARSCWSACPRACPPSSTTGFSPRTSRSTTRRRASPSTSWGSCCSG